MLHNCNFLYEPSLELIWHFGQLKRNHLRKVHLRVNECMGHAPPSIFFLAHTVTKKPLGGLSSLKVTSSLFLTSNYMTDLNS